VMHMPFWWIWEREASRLWGLVWELELCLLYSVLLILEGRSDKEDVGSLSLLKLKQLSFVL
jgi:hypothetical protein